REAYSSERGHRATQMAAVYRLYPTVTYRDHDGSLQGYHWSRLAGAKPGWSGYRIGHWCSRAQPHASLRPARLDPSALMASELGSRGKFRDASLKQASLQQSPAIREISAIRFPERKTYPFYFLSSIINCNGYRPMAKFLSYGRRRSGSSRGLGVYSHVDQPFDHHSGCNSQKSCHSHVDGLHFRFHDLWIRSH